MGCDFVSNMIVDKSDIEIVRDAMRDAQSAWRQLVLCHHSLSPVLFVDLHVVPTRDKRERDCHAVDCHACIRFHRRDLGLGFARQLSRAFQLYFAPATLWKLLC